MTAKPPIIERLIAVALLAAVLACLAWLTLGQYLTQKAELEQGIRSIQEERELLAKRRFSLDDLSKIERTMVDIETSEPQLLLIENERLAIAETQEQVRQRVESSGAELLRVEARSIRPFEGSDLLEVLVDVQFEVLQPLLPALIETLEGEDKTRDLSLEKLSIRAEDPYRALQEQEELLLRGNFQGVMFFRTAVGPTDEN